MSGAKGFNVVVKVLINVQFKSNTSRVHIIPVPSSIFSVSSDEDRDL
jgi:hypothetical protein